ncbi:MAG: hypothetical protein FJX65_06910 [Alphaproteobacteria bacterium]|nr:hypothetical protein [Alphaproteobacteria bacterium]
MTKFVSNAWFLCAATCAVLGAAVPGAAQDAKDTLRVAMYAQATVRGNVYGLPYIWPNSYYWEAAFDSFVRIDDKAMPGPFAVEKWELVNPTTWRLTFRQDIEYGSGRKNDAANIVKTFDFLTSDAGKSAGVMRGVRIATYRAVGPHTVEFVTSVPDPLMIHKFAPFYVVDMAAFTEMGADVFAAKPVTSGPFRVVNWTDQEMTTTAHDKSWRPAKVKNLKIVNVPEAASRLAALESGQMDIVFNLGPDDVPRVRASGHVAAIEGAPFVNALAMFTTDFANKWNLGGKTPFSDRRVRQAANHAINRDTLVKDFLLGLATASGQPATASIFGYNPDVKPYPFDPVKAKQLLTEAGYPNGLSVKMEATPITSGTRDVLQLIASDLGKVGIKVNVEVVPFSTRATLYFQNKWQGDMTTFAMNFSPAMDASVPFSI